LRKRIISESAALAKTRRVEAIQIVASSGPNADENHLRRLLAEGLDVHQSTAISTHYTTIDSEPSAVPSRGCPTFSTLTHEHEGSGK
jgi:hypothetical protein